MKPPGTESLLLHYRDQELYEAFRREMIAARRINKRYIYRRLADTPSSRFWVTHRSANNILTKMFRAYQRQEDPAALLHSLTPVRREMYTELFARALRLFSQYPTMHISDISKRVVVQPAPKFYLTPASIHRTLRLYIRSLRSARQ